jgi:hypothetical protein
MAKHDHTWSHLADMACRLHDDPDETELAARATFEAEEIVAYAGQDAAEATARAVFKTAEATCSSRSVAPPG